MRSLRILILTALAVSMLLTAILAVSPLLESVRAQTGSSLPAVTVGRFQMITEDGLWILDTSTGNNWKWECVGPTRTIQPTGIRVCDGDYGWVGRLM